MVLKYLLSALVNKAQVVEKLSESLPVRSAAKLTARAVLRAQEAGREAAGRALSSRTVQQIRREAAEVPRGPRDLSQKVRRLRESLVEDVRDGLTEASRSRQPNRPKQVRHRKE